MIELRFICNFRNPRRLKPRSTAPLLLILLLLFFPFILRADPEQTVTNHTTFDSLVILRRSGGACSADRLHLAPQQSNTVRDSVGTCPLTRVDAYFFNPPTKKPFAAARPYVGPVDGNNAFVLEGEPRLGFSITRFAR